MKKELANRRILVVDDNQAIHDDIRAVLEVREANSDLLALSESLFDEKETSKKHAVSYEIDSAFQGEEGFNRVKKALEEGKPYSLAFVDVRMPPGWNGIQTVEEMKKVDPNLQIVICTAFSDYSWEQTLETLGKSDWLLVLKKPFDVIEIQQLAFSLTEKWNLSKHSDEHQQGLEKTVEHTSDQLQIANQKLQDQLDSLEEANKQLSQEVTARREAEEQVRHMAYHDALTNLPNRLLLLERIEGCMQRNLDNPDYQYAVLYCDIDNFKSVNDSLGHRIGDQLLLQSSQRMANTLFAERIQRKDSLDIVARLGGDEFVILLDDISGVEQAIQIATQFRNAINQPMRIEQNDLVPSISIGVATNSNEHNLATDILRDSDSALYHAKKHGKDRVELFDQAMQERITKRTTLENEIRAAIEQGQFTAYYQPIISLETGKIISVEALARWIHPTDGIRAPDKFIPIAEESGMIESLGEIILAEAISQLSHWRRTIPGAENLFVNINLSPKQLLSKNLINFIDNCIEENNLDPHALRLELTETAMLSDLEMVKEIMSGLVARKIGIHLDDFGTGYSSLSILHSLPFSTIKIDRSFVSLLAEDIENATTIQAIVMIAHNKGMKIVAEGIENQEQLTLLKELGCDFGQGYLLSKPMPVADTTNYLMKEFQSSSLKLKSLVT